MIFKTKLFLLIKPPKSKFSKGKVFEVKPCSASAEPKKEKGGALKGLTRIVKIKVVGFRNVSKDL